MMRALRRASVYLKNGRFSLGASRSFHLRPKIGRCSLNVYNPGDINPQEPIFNGFLASTRSFNTSTGSKVCMDAHAFSTQAGTESSGEESDDLEDGFSELETPNEFDTVRQTALGVGKSDELASEPDASEEEAAGNELGTEIDGGTISDKTRAISPMTQVILDAPTVNIFNVLDKWVEEGNEVTRKEVTMSFLNLRRWRLFAKALKLSEWLEAAKHLDFGEGDYASRVDLIAKTSDIFKAEKYVYRIPESFRGELVYRTLLANCVSTTHVKKSEEVFNKMKDLKFPLTCFTCNQLLILFKRTDKKKIADILLLMEKENIKPSLFTYQILVDVKGLANDIAGMELVVETMKAEGLELNYRIQTSLAQHYAAAGLKDKALSVLKEIEGSNTKENRGTYHTLLPIYASFGMEDEVDRLWKVCESNPRLSECMNAIIAWGKLNRIELAESTFEIMLKKLKRPSSKHFSVLLKVYTDHNLLSKGKELINRMAETGCAILPSSLDSIIKLYVESGEVEKADYILGKAVKQNKGKPMFSSFLTIMDQYAKRGDIHSAEKLFQNMKKVGYVSRLQQYRLLLQTYINAKAPIYGFPERLKADNIYPDKTLEAMLSRVDPFRKSELDELLG